MVVEWRKSASDLVPPNWLLKGVTVSCDALASIPRFPGKCRMDCTHPESGLTVLCVPCSIDICLS